MSMKKKNQIDLMLLSIVIFILMVGVLTIYSASSFIGAEKYGDSVLYLKKHLIRVVIGFGMMWILIRIDYHYIRWITPFMCLTFFLMLIVVLRIDPFHGTNRFLLFLGKRFQPSEFMKLSLVFYLAAIFSRGKDAKVIHGKKLYLHYIFVMVVTLLVFIEPDLGSAMVLFFVVLIMFFIGGVPIQKLLRMGMGLIPIVIVGTLKFSYQRKRIVEFVSSVVENGAPSYQVKQSIIGLANGGIVGVGYGEGKQKLLFLPEPFSDFILSSFGEEWGFLGIFLLFLLIFVFLWRGISIAIHAPDRYGYLLAGGITSMFLINGLVNAGVAINLLPTTGLPFPLMSYGGSSILVHLIGIGILLNISKNRVVLYHQFTAQRGKRGLICEENLEGF